MSDATQTYNSILYGFEQQLDGTFAKIVKSVPYTPVTLAVHSRVHEGRLFSGGYYTATLADNASLDMLIQVGSQTETHANILVICGGDALYSIYEGTIFSSQGSVINTSNHNRNSSKLLDAVITYNPVITSNGLQINGTTFLSGGQKTHASGGVWSLAEELILKANTSYLFRLTNISGLSKPANILFTGYQPNL